MRKRRRVLHRPVDHSIHRCAPDLGYCQGPKFQHRWLRPDKPLISQLLAIRRVLQRKPDALRFLIDQMAARTAQEINTSELAKLAKIKRETVDQYLDILLRLSMVTKLSAWTPGEGKRDIKQPKFHFVDTGIAMALRRLNDRSFEIGNRPEALGGASAELCRR